MFNIQFRITQDKTNKQALEHAWDTRDMNVVYSWSVQKMRRYCFLNLVILRNYSILLMDTH